MNDYDQAYKEVSIIDDGSNGKISLSALSRHGDTRKTKIKNNFTGLLESADSLLLSELCEKLNDKLQLHTDDATIVGMYKSGIIVAGFLALHRGARFNWSTPDKIGEYQDAICYMEDHREDKAHYLYGLKSTDRVIVVEDEITSGKGVVGLTVKLREHGIEVVSICSILETVNFGGRNYIKSETGIDLVSLAKVELS